MITFPFYANKITTVKPIKNVDLDYFLRLIKFSTPQLIDVFESLKQVTDESEKRILKENLYYANPAVTTDMQGRSYSNITGFTGLMPLDFDKLDCASDFKHYLFENYTYIIAAWLSASGHGVRALVNIPICKDVTEYKHYFWGLAHAGFKDYNGFDRAPQNCVLPLFISYDKDILIRPNASQWTGKSDKDLTKNRTNFSQPIEYKSNTNFEKWTILNFQKAISKIVDNGHPQVRAAAYALGGRVGAGYIDRFTAIAIAEAAIAVNSYLSKGTAGYQKTAREMIERGINSPLFF